MLLYSTAGPADVPFIGGTLCVNLPLQRGPLQNSAGSSSGNDCSGYFALKLEDWFLNGTDFNLFLGTPVHAQYWFRDPGDPFEAGLTNAIKFLWCD